jgi:membrane protein DedA with SNARE-associated domain
MFLSKEEIISVAYDIPVELFAFVGSFVEELISQIPSPVILLTAGTIIHKQQNTILTVLLISAIASAGKTLASLVYYFIADRSEQFLLSTVGTKIGFTHRELEKISQYFSGTRKDDIFIFLARAIPIMPTTLISVACGFLHFRLYTFATATFAGYFIRCLLFTYLGFIGIRSIEAFTTDITISNTSLFYTLIVLLALNIVWFYYKRNKTEIRHYIETYFKKK